MLFIRVHSLSLHSFSLHSSSLHSLSISPSHSHSSTTFYYINYGARDIFLGYKSFYFMCTLIRVLSTQYSVLSTQYSVLSTQYSVLSTAIWLMSVGLGLYVFSSIICYIHCIISSRIANGNNC